MSSIAAMVTSIKKKLERVLLKIREKWELFKKNKIIFYKNVSKKQPRNTREISERYQREHNKRKQKRPYWKNKYLSYSNCYHNLLYRFRKILTNT